MVWCLDLLCPDFLDEGLLPLEAEVRPLETEDLRLDEVLCFFELLPLEGVLVPRVFLDWLD